MQFGRNPHTIKRVVRDRRKVMSEYRYKYQGELNDGRQVCDIEGCDSIAVRFCMCAEHASALEEQPDGSFRVTQRLPLKPRHPSTANTSYTIAHGFYATGPKGGK